MPLFLGEEGRARLQATPTSRLPIRLATLLSASHSRTIDLFRLLDKNADGMVTRQELGSALAKLGVQSGADDIDELFYELDPVREAFRPRSSRRRERGTPSSGARARVLTRGRPRRITTASSSSASCSARSSTRSGRTRRRRRSFATSRRRASRRRASSGRRTAAPARRPRPSRAAAGRTRPRRSCSSSPR